MTDPYIEYHHSDPANPQNESDTYTRCEYVEDILQLKQCWIDYYRTNHYTNFFYHACPRCSSHNCSYSCWVDFPSGRHVCYNCGLIFNLYLCGVVPSLPVHPSAYETTVPYVFEGMEMI